MNNIVGGVTMDRSRHLVLVVDDNPATRYATSRTFQAAGFKTAEAVGGAQALSMDMTGVSAVVLDVHLPDIDGFEVCRQWRGDPKTRSLPVLHLSAHYIEDKDKVDGLNSGADAYLTHPAEPPILIATVQALIRARLAEEELRKSEAKFRAIYTEAESGIALVDSAGAFVEANPAMLRMLGRVSDEVIGHQVWEFAPSDSAQLVRSLFAREDSVLEQWREIFPLSVPHSDDVHLEWTMSPHIEPGLRVGIASNISARMKFQAQREDLLNRETAARIIAEQHSQTKNNFIAILSHELRNPLNSILMAVDMLLARGGGADETTAGLEMIKRNANTQARIIADILDMARMNSGKMNLVREPVDAKALVAASLEGMKADIERRQLVVRVEADSCDESSWLDPTRFQQIFWNIFNNAVKFSEQGGTIEVSLSTTEEMLTLVVRDYGKGIEAEFLETIFDKFTQGAAPGNRSHGGLGLGMAIVRQLTELHRGTVRVESEGLGKGAKVVVHIPTVVPSQNDEVLHTDSPPSGADADLSNVIILVVEDEPQNREMLRLVFRDRGAHVRTAGSYDEALQSLLEVTPDIIVSDIGLPGNDGYDLMLEVRRRERTAHGSRRVAAIALTAFARPEDVARTLEVGFDAHLAKPLSVMNLLVSVSALVKMNARL
jgi:PAS domain S-box-containing protein